MSYATQTIWRGIYSSHQRCLAAVERLALNVDDDQCLTQADYVQLLQYRLKTAKGETRNTVLNHLRELNSSVDAPEPVPSPPRVKSAKTKRASNTQPAARRPRLIRAVESLAYWTTSPAAIFLTLLGALALQIHHLASLVHRVNANDGLWLAYVFATVSELTALMLTVHQARKHMLIVFALLQCWINILYYCELPGLMIRLTLSGLIAFVIYAYSELFTSLRRTDGKQQLFKP